MNFISKVINIVGENEIADARACLRKILKEIKTTQKETYLFINENNAEFIENMNNNDDLLNQADRLVKEVETIVESVENETKSDLLSMASDVQQYLSELEELRVGLRLNNRILRIEKLFSNLEEIKHSGRLVDMRRLVDELHGLVFSEEDEEIFKQLDCYKNIKVRWFVEKETLLNSVRMQFDSLIQMTEKTYQNSKKVTVKIKKNSETIHEVVKMHFETTLNVQRFSNFLMDNVFEPIITTPTSLEISETDLNVTLTTKDDDFVVIELSYSTKKLVNNESLQLRPNYKTVFKNLNKVFAMLRRFDTDGNFMLKHLADHIGERFSKTVIDECLTFAIPKTLAELGESTLVSDIKAFAEVLKFIEFEKDDLPERSLAHFADQIDVIFKKRFCTNILNDAVEIMRKDLHDMQIIEESKTDGEFPRCMVSRSTTELIELMERVISNSAPTATTVEPYVIEDIQERLKSTIPMIIERYLTETIEAHGKLLQTIPQQTALFHNNCLYLSWWLSKLEMQPTNSANDERNGTLILNLQELGSAHFGKQIKNQRSQMKDILKEFDLSDSIVEIGSQPLKIIRQCLRQLELLKNVWQTILPAAVYNKTMGTILNDFCEEIIAKIMAREDISSSVANGLVNICETIIERAPLVFADTMEVTIHVKNWSKLQQIKMVLNASMAEIVEQWADGKGPLTLNFSSDDIRRLIRALFQNTDRRARVLANII